MPKPSDECVLPISEVNKMADEMREVRALVIDVIASGRFAGAALADLPADPEDAHENSICSVNLRAALKLRDFLR